MIHQDDHAIEDHLEQLEERIVQIEQLTDPAAKAAARALVESILGFHGLAIARVLDRIAAIGPAGLALLDSFGDDQPISSLLLLYGLHPRPLKTRVEQALERVRPYLLSHGGNVELVAVDDGVVRLRLLGNCHGCPSSSSTFERAIEEAIHAAAPDAAAIELLDMAAPSVAAAPPLVQLQPLGAR